MRKFLLLIFLILTFVCSCSEKKETASDWLNKEKTLWDGAKYSDPKKAIEYLDHAIGLQPNNPEYINKRGTAYYNLGKYQRAIEDYGESIRLLPDYFLAYHNRANAYANLGQFQKAIEDYNQAIRVAPGYVEAYKNRGIVLLNQGDKKLGCADIRKACSLGDCKLLELSKTQGLCK